VTVTTASFRQTLPEFTDASLYDGNFVIPFYINLAVNCFQNALRWDPNCIDYGTCLFVAHHLVLEARAAQTAAVGGIPGTVEGVRTAKSVDKVAIGYDAETVTLNAQASFWNMTNYGIRFLQLTRMFGAGGYQLGGPCGVGSVYTLGPL
jgi:hypothetical protein